MDEDYPWQSQRGQNKIRAQGLNRILGEQSIGEVKGWGRWRGERRESGRWRGDREREWKKKKDDIEFYGIRNSDVVAFGGGKKNPRYFSY